MDKLLDHLVSVLTTQYNCSEMYGDERLRDSLSAILEQHNVTFGGEKNVAVECHQNAHDVKEGATVIGVKLSL